MQLIQLQRNSVRNVPMLIKPRTLAQPLPLPIPTKATGAAKAAKATKATKATKLQETPGFVGSVVWCRFFRYP